MPKLKMTPEEIRAYARATIKRMEREAKEWEERENRRLKAELKQKVAAHKARAKGGEGD
jgi:polyhydroxyalkanoate synthesis regulator phasin